jgi:hypothetical protein
LPVFRTPAVQIVTLYPGMPPEVVERDIMSRLQRWTGQSVGIAHQEAKAMCGVCIVKDFFNEDIDDATAMSQVTSLARSAMFYLPPGTLPPMVMPFDPTGSPRNSIMSEPSAGSGRAKRAKPDEDVGAWPSSGSDVAHTRAPESGAPCLFVRIAWKRTVLPTDGSRVVAFRRLDASLAAWAAL